MNLQEFNYRLKKLEEQVVTAVQMFEDDTHVTVNSLRVEMDADGNCTVSTNLAFPEEAE
jgi:hypothetical protein